MPHVKTFYNLNNPSSLMKTRRGRGSESNPKEIGEKTENENISNQIIE